MPTKVQVRVYSLAFVTYFGFYVSREPFSLVKATLLESWYPFDGPDGWLLLGLLDTAGLTAYAIGMFIVGYLCEKYDSLHVLVLGCFGAGTTTILYGMADFWDIHSYWYFLVLRILNGFFEAFGWPTLIKMLDFYFCMEEKRDFILTAFGSCKFFGIIVGSIISSFSLSFEDWGYCFIYCGLVVIALGGIDMFFLPNLPAVHHDDPETVAILNDEGKVTEQGKSSQDLEDSDGEKGPEYAGRGSNEVFFMALNLPGILDYSMHLFFIKLGVYVLYYWLPTWLVSLTIGSSGEVSYVDACWYTALWGFGGVIGTLLVGVSVYLNRQYGIVSGASMVTSGLVIIILYWYSRNSCASLVLFLVLLMLVGVFQMGPYSLSTSCMPSVLNDLYGDQNAKIVGMATGIIDGIGSVGAIMGPLSGALILQYTTYGWSLVFMVVAVASFLAFLVLIRQVYNEVTKLVSGN